MATVIEKVHGGLILDPGFWLIRCVYGISNLVGYLMTEYDTKRYLIVKQPSWSLENLNITSLLIHQKQPWLGLVVTVTVPFMGQEDVLVIWLCSIAYQPL